MSAGTFQIYDNWKLRTIQGDIQKPKSNTLTMALLTSDHTPDPTTQVTWGDISGDEVTDADYAQQTLSGVSITLSGSTVLFDAGNVSFGSNVNIEAKYAAIMVGVGDSTDPLITYVDLETGGDTQRSVNSTFEVRLPNGIYEAT